nr:MAG TPA: hypothetical protein [Caudoviricetes sp.]
MSRINRLKNRDKNPDILGIYIGTCLSLFLSRFFAGHVGGTKRLKVATLSPTYNDLQLCPDF